MEEHCKRPKIQKCEIVYSCPKALQGGLVVASADKASLLGSQFDSKLCREQLSLLCLIFLTLCPILWLSELLSFFVSFYRIWHVWGCWFFRSISSISNNCCLCYCSIIEHNFSLAHSARIVSGVLTGWNFTEVFMIANKVFSGLENLVVVRWKIRLYKPTSEPTIKDRFEVLDRSFLWVNFSKLTHNNKIFRNYFVCNHYHLCKRFPSVILLYLQIFFGATLSVVLEYVLSAGVCSNCWPCTAACVLNRSLMQRNMILQFSSYSAQSGKPAALLILYTWIIMMALYVYAMYKVVCACNVVWFVQQTREEAQRNV